jgi:DNA-binding transcriptional regulator YhcF (GntR family)
MAQFSDSHNRLCQAESGQASQQKAGLKEPREGGAGRDAGRMLCIDTTLLYGKDRLSQVELALLGYISDHPVEQGSRKAIAEACGCAANSIPRAAKKLETKGILERVKGGGSAHTIYKITRNPKVTTSNMEVARNTEVTTAETLMLRAASSASEGETTTTDMAVTVAAGTRNSPPPHPPNNTNSLSEDNHQPSEPNFEGGLGELFGDEPRPKRIRRKQAPKFVASDETLPAQLTPEMREIATEARLINGTCDQQFAQWRRWHIREKTVMSYPARSWQTWVNNWAKRNPPGVDGVPRGYKLAGYGPDGAARYVKDQRANVYR